MNPSALLPVAHEAIDVASKLVRGSVPGTLTAKGDRDMASEVDFAVERAVRRFLQEATPTIDFLGEEEGVSGHGADLVWTLDPVDGTANLVHGLPLCAVSLGLVRRGRPVLGVIDLPFLESRYSAIEGQGAQVDGRTLQTSQTVNLHDAIVAIGDYAVGTNAEAKNSLRLALTAQLAATALRVRMFGSAAIDLAWVAEGRLDASIILGNKPWDMAAGVVIAREAGAHVVDRDGSPHTADSAATVAIAPRLVDQVVALIRQVEEDATVAGQ
jgi:myo-inositol-1(or 4)-monophosphatase